MAWSRRNTVVSIGSPLEPGNVILPVDTLIIRAIPYTGNDGTIIDLHGGRKKFVPPTFGYRIEMEWSHLRDEYKPETHGTIVSAVNLLINNPTGISFWAERQSDGVWNSERVVPNALLDMGEDTLNAVFNSSVRRKPARLILVSRASDYLLSEVDWIL